jgi:hypothetical protein
MDPRVAAVVVGSKSRTARRPLSTIYEEGVGGSGNGGSDNSNNPDTRVRELIPITDDSEAARQALRDESLAATHDARAAREAWTAIRWLGSVVRLDHGGGNDDSNGAATVAVDYMAYLALMSNKVEKHVSAFSRAYGAQVRLDEELSIVQAGRVLQPLYDWIQLMCESHALSLSSVYFDTKGAIFVLFSIPGTANYAFGIAMSVAHGADVGMFYKCAHAIAQVPGVLRSAELSARAGIGAISDSLRVVHDTPCRIEWYAAICLPLQFLTDRDIWERAYL